MDRLAAFPAFMPGQNKVPAAHFNAIRDVAQRIQRGGVISPGEPQAIVKTKADIAVNASGAVIQVSWNTTTSQYDEVGREFDALNIGPEPIATGEITVLSFATDAAPFFAWSGGAMQDQNFYFRSDASSDLAGYKQMTYAHATTAAVSYTATISGANTAIEEFATESGVPAAVLARAQLISVHLHAQKTNVTNKVPKLKVLLYKRAAGGTETLIATTEETDALDGAIRSFEIHAAISDTTLASTDRLVAKVVGNATGTGTNPTVALWIEGLYYSHLHIAFQSSSEAGGTWSLQSATDTLDNDYQLQTYPESILGVIVPGTGPALVWANFGCDVSVVTGEIYEGAVLRCRMSASGVGSSGSGSALVQGGSSVTMELNDGGAGRTVLADETFIAAVSLSLLKS